MRIIQSLLLTLAIFATGCVSASERKATRAVDDYFAGDFDRAARTLEPLAKKPDSNFVLNNLRLGSAELGRYDLDGAEGAFLKAYEVMNSFGVNNGGRSLGAVLVDEKIRIWKGEPFERAMANFYLGLTYYMRQDYNNARAAFENALFKLKDYDDKTDQKDVDAESNFVVASIMLGRCWQRLGREDLAKAEFETVAKNRPNLAALADYQRNAQSNALLVIEFGHGPERATTFDGSIVGFAPSPGEVGRVPSPRVHVDGESVNVQEFRDAPIDLLAMAQDRKWQSIDTIRTVKSAIGTGLLYGGAFEGVRGLNESGSRQRTDLMVSGGLLATGLLLKATSQADTRGWEMLPRSVFLIPLKLPPGTHDVTVDFPHTNGLSQTWNGLVVPEQGEATYLFHMQRYNAGPFNWPPPAMANAAQ